MIKKFCFTAIMALCVQMASAQVNVQRDYVPDNQNTKSLKENVEKENTFVCKFGVKAGVNLSNLSNNLDGVDPGFGMGVGFRIGAIANLRWGQRTENSLPGTGLFGIQPEVLFSSMQVKSDVENIKFQTIQVPIMLKVYPTAQFSIEVGPEFSYFMSTSPDQIDFNGTTIKTGDIKGLTFGLGGGLAYDFDMGLTVGARYSYGFNKMAKNIDWKNSNIQITVGWLF